MTALLSSFLPYIIAGVVGLLGIWRVYAFGKSTERNKLRAKEADAYEQSLKDLENAASAGSRVRPSDSLSDDPYNRG